MNSGLAVSAEMTRSPRLRARSLFGGNCSLFLTMADCAPAVERPSSHVAASMKSTEFRDVGLAQHIRHASQHWDLVYTADRSRICLRDKIGGPARRDEDERRRALVEARRSSAC